MIVRIPDKSKSLKINTGIYLIIYIFSTLSNYSACYVNYLGVSRKLISSNKFIFFTLSKFILYRDTSTIYLVETYSLI